MFQTDMSEKPCCSVQLIDGQGVFKEAELNIFMKDVELSGCGLSYAVVSIMGPQSSGKITLLNHLFHTNFREVDAFKGRSQTTQGIWLSNAVGSKPFTVVMDLEGTDGREKEDDTTFEKQSALFALAVSDIVLINLWCHDIGREQAANKPLFKTVFQVMMRLFSPRKTTLLFVIRDKTKTPLEVLEPILREDIQKIWESVPKPPKHKLTPLSEFFNVEITALSSYEEKEELFKEQVSLLRRRCFQSIVPGGLAGDRRAVVPASGFPFSIKQIWQNIKENKDLDLPAHKVMVATVLCEEIAKEKVDHLTNDEDWRELEKEVQSGPIPGFGEKLSTILKTYFLSYDMEVVYFEESVRTKYRQQMVNESLNLVYPAYQAMVKHLHSKALNRFKEEVEEAVKKGQFAFAVKHSGKSCIAEFDEGCSDATIVQASWDPSKSREKLQQEIDAYWGSRTAIPYATILSKAGTQLRTALTEVLSLSKLASPDIWPSLREFLKNEPERAVSNAVSNFSKKNAGYGIDDEARNKMVAEVKCCGRMLVKKTAEKVDIHMKDRFSAVFRNNNESWPRLSNGRVDFQASAKDARSASLKLLAAMAALRLDEKPDNIEATLSCALIDGIGTTVSLLEGSSSSSVNPLVSNTWEGFSPSDVLLEPIKCECLWKRFVLETQVIVDHALAVQEEKEQKEQLRENERREFEERRLRHVLRRIAEREERRLRKIAEREELLLRQFEEREERRMLRQFEEHRQSLIPPTWAIVALVVLGLNEFMALLRNPIYILVIFVPYLLGKAPFVQLDIPGDLLRFLNVMSDRLLTSLFPRHYGH